jgi:hemin uptake protein HemP
MNDEDSTKRPAAGGDPPPREDQRRVWQSEELLGGATEALIMHAGEAYRLRRTKSGKLILYK